MDNRGTTNKYYFPTQTSLLRMRTSNSGAMNVNCLEQSVSELQTVVLRTNSKAADNRVGGSARI